MRAHIGRRGWTIGEQRSENDGSSPAGMYSIGHQSFGLGSNPGVHGSWFDVGPDDWWVSDPGSAFYNTHQVGPPNDRWDPTYGEQLANVGPVAYTWATFIEFNSPPQGALGSAVFLHLDTGGSTAGCVALAQDDLLAVLRWLDPARNPRIAMGPESYVLVPPAPAPTVVTEPTTTSNPVVATSTTTVPTTTTATTSTTTTTTTTAPPVGLKTKESRDLPWIPGAVGAGVLAVGGALAWRRQRG